jgi:hypothetical protein
VLAIEQGEETLVGELVDQAAKGEVLAERDHAASLP